MKLICFAVIIYAFPLYAQDECDYKLYVDSLYGFSMEVPYNQNIEQISYAKNRYRVKELEEFQYLFFIESKSIFLSSLRPDDKLDPADTLLSIAENKCYFSLRSTGPGGASYGRVDTLY